MPGKAKRKGKHPQSKKSKVRLRQVTPARTPEASEPTAAAAAPAPVREAAAPPRPAVTRPAARSRAAANVVASAERYPFFVPELKRIGLLAVIIIVVLVVISFVLS
jgi:hypothetical protein